MGLNVSQVFSDTMRSISERFGSLLILWLIFLGIGVAGYVVISMAFVGALLSAVGAAGVAGTTDPSASMLAAMGAGGIFAVVLAYLLFFYYMMAYYGSLTTMSSLLHRPDIGKALGDGFRSGFTILLAYILLWIPLFIVLLVLGFVFRAMGSVGEILNLVVAFAISVIIWIKFSVLVPTVAVEGVRNPITALTRSWNLTNGNGLQLFVVMLVVIAVSAIVFGGFFFAYWGSFTELAAGSPASGVGSIIFMMLILMVLWVAFTIFANALGAAIHAQLVGPSGAGLEDTFG